MFSLSAITSAALPMLQQLDESMMTTPCVIARPGDPVIDENTGNLTNTESVVFSGFCQIVAREAQVRTSASGSAQLITQLYLVKVPVSAGPFQDKDVVTVPGRTLLVQGLDLETWQTSQHLPVIEVV